MKTETQYLSCQCMVAHAFNPTRGMWNSMSEFFLFLGKILNMDSSPLCRKIQYQNIKYICMKFSELCIWKIMQISNNCHMLAVGQNTCLLIFYVSFPTVTGANTSNQRTEPGKSLPIKKEDTTRVLQPVAYITCYQNTFSHPIINKEITTLAHGQRSNSMLVGEA